MNSKCAHCPLASEARSCPGQRNNRVCYRAEKAPGIVQKIANFTVAAVKHVAAGRPMATQEQKNARLAICGACEYFDSERQGCRKCGCNLNAKAGWADSACPLTPPKWEAVVPPAQSP